VLDVERSNIANLSSLVIFLVGVEKLPIVNPPEGGLKPDIEAWREMGGGMAAELDLWRPEPPRVNG
jgi:hypothetical protein